jgi:hypothetical protein
MPWEMSSSGKCEFAVEALFEGMMSISPLFCVLCLLTLTIFGFFKAFRDG